MAVADPPANSDRGPDDGPFPDRAVTVAHLGEERTVAPPGTLEFGRHADLTIDSNPLLHRRLGRVVHRDGVWWLENVGGSITLRVADPATGAVSLLPAGTRVALTASVSHVSFVAGQAHYEVVVRLGSPVEPVASGPPPAGGTVTRTADLPLNTEQRALLVVLCETRLRDPAAELVLPTNAAAASRLGWTERKFNRKLDWLCERYHRAGIGGLKSSRGRALGRRRRLAEYALDAGLVCPADLALLP